MKDAGAEQSMTNVYIYQIYYDEKVQGGIGPWIYTAGQHQ